MLFNNVNMNVYLMSNTTIYKNSAIIFIIIFIAIFHRDNILYMTFSKEIKNVR